MKKLLYSLLLPLLLATSAQNAGAAGQEIKDDSGGMFMEETTPTPPAGSQPKSIPIDLSNVGVPTDPHGHIVPMIDRDAPGGVRQNFSNLEVYSEPPINFIQTPGFNSFGQPFNAFAPPVPLMPPPYTGVGLNLGRNFRLNLAVPNYGYGPWGGSPYGGFGFGPFGGYPYGGIGTGPWGGASPYGGFGNAPVVGAAPFGIPGAPFGGATAPFGYGYPPYGLGGFGGPIGYPGFGGGLGFGGPFSYPGFGGGLGFGGPFMYSSPFGYGGPLGGSSLFSAQTNGLGLGLFLPNKVEWQSTSTFTPLTPNLDGPP
jgi:hypothetical protein